VFIALLIALAVVAVLYAGNFVRYLLRARQRSKLTALYGSEGEGEKALGIGGAAASSAAAAAEPVSPTSKLPLHPRDSDAQPLSGGRAQPRPSGFSADEVEMQIMRAPGGRPGAGGGGRLAAAAGLRPSDVGAEAETPKSARDSAAELFNLSNNKDRQLRMSVAHRPAAAGSIIGRDSDQKREGAIGGREILGSSPVLFMNNPLEGLGMMQGTPSVSGDGLARGALPEGDEQVDPADTAG
jgi:hypothetical protein